MRYDMALPKTSGQAQPYRLLEVEIKSFYWSLFDIFLFVGTENPGLLS